MCAFLGCGHAGILGAGTHGLVCSAHFTQHRRNGELKPLIKWQKREPNECQSNQCSQVSLAGHKYCDEHLSFNARHDRTGGTYLKCPVGHCDNVYTPRNKTRLCKNHALLARIYGLNAASLVQVYSDYRCQICGSEGPSLHIDHDHSCCSSLKRPKCGRCVRGLLCMHCNHLVGNAMDDESILLSAIDYLRRTRLRLVA